MKKLITVPISLLASMALLVGCGGNQKPSSEALPEEPESSETSEVTPEPPEEEVVEIKFPESLAEAEVVDFGDLKYNYGLAYEIYESGKGANYDFIKENTTKVKLISANWEYDFEGQNGVLESSLSSVELFEDDIFEWNKTRDIYREFEGIGTLHSYFTSLKMMGVRIGEVDYYNADYQESENVHTNQWGFNPQDYAGQEINNILYGVGADYLSDAYMNVGDYHYFVDAYSNGYGQSTDDVYGITFNYYIKEITEIVYKFDADYKLLGYYEYYEILTDHDLFSGRPFNEPKVFRRNLNNISFEYKENNVYPNKDALVASVPDVQNTSASFGYRSAKVRLGESGQLTAAPIYPDSYTMISETQYYDNDHMSLYFEFDPSDNTAIDFTQANFFYLVLQGEEMNSTHIEAVNFLASAYLHEIAEALGASIKTFDGNEYLIMEKDAMAGMLIVFPTHELPVFDNISFVPVEVSPVLLP